MIPPSSASRLRIIPIAAAQVIGLLCGLASIRLNSHLVPPQVLGVYGVFLTFTPIGMWLVYVGLLKFVSRHWAASADRGALLREVLGVWVRRLPWLALLAAAGTVAILPGERALWPVLWIVLLLTTALLTIGALAQAALQAERAHWRDCAVTAAAALTRSFGPPLFYAATSGAAALWLGFGFHAVIFAAAGLWALHVDWWRTADSGPAQSQLKPVYEGPLFTVLAAANWALSGLNRWLVAFCFGNAEAGYFTLAGGAAVILTAMLGTCLMQYVQPSLFALGDGPGANRVLLARRTDLTSVLYAAAGLAGLALLVAISPALVGPLFSPRYRDAMEWLFPAGCFGVATMMAGYYHIMLLAGGRERACGPVDLSTAAVLAAGCVVTAFCGQVWLIRWLAVTPLVPLLLTRPLARHYLFKPASGAARAPDRSETSA